MALEKLSISWHTDIGEIAPEEWNRLADPLPTPVLDYEWLRRMEASKSVSPRYGWLPCHLAVRRGDTLVAAAALYVKGHSEGEFVWDYVWADVASQLDIAYYPKLIGMSPATPAVGYRFLIAAGEDEAAMTDFMLCAVDAFCEANRLSGAHFLFVDPRWGRLLPASGYLGWYHQSYEWRNTGFATFDDYLASFRKNQRRNIRRERRSLREAGLTITLYTGDEIPDFFPQLMWRYYERTNDQFGPWAAKYLTREFFDERLLDFRRRLLFVAATRADDPDTPIALSMLLTKRDTLIGRYWGTDAYVENLHFDACYYAPIEWAIEKGISRFDPGAGSPHKLRRGFIAVGNYSYHRFRNKRLQEIMETHIGRMNRTEHERIERMNGTVPLKELPADLAPLAGFYSIVR